MSESGILGPARKSEKPLTMADLTKAISRGGFMRNHGTLSKPDWRPVRDAAKPKEGA